MKLVHIITGLKRGGAENVLYRLLAHQDQNEWPSTVVSLTSGGVMAEKIEALGIRVHSLDMRPGWPSFMALVRLTRMLHRLQPDAVQTWMYHANLLGGLAARLAGIRRVFWGLRHTTMDPEVDKLTTIWVAHLGGWLSGLIPYRIICCSKATWKTHLDAGYCRERMVIIPNGYNLEQYRPDPEARSHFMTMLDLPGQIALVGMAARYHPQKDHATFLSAAAQLLQEGLDAEFLLCGSGVENGNATLTRMITEQGLQGKVHLLGERSDMTAFFSALDVATLSSSHGEGFPNVVAEAMACGALVVSTDVGDAAEMIGDAGWVVPPSDATALASTWKKALSLSPTLRKEVGDRARKRVRSNYSLSSMVAAYEMEYQGRLAAH